MPSRSFASLLADHDYRTVLRAAEWVECLVSRGGESWMGRGATEQDALEDVLAQMLPSALARAIVLQEVRVASSASEPHVANSSDVRPMTKEPCAAASGEVEPAVDETSGGGRGNDDLPQRIERALPTFAVLAPNRQRLRLLEWICEARALAERAPRDSDVEVEVCRIASRLRELAGTYWPGSVRVLQASARPADVLGSEAPTEAVPTTWTAAWEHVQRRLTRLDAEGSLDRDGWADVTERSPEAPDPDMLLGRASSAIDTVLGPRLDAVPRGLDAAETDALVGGARSLRWVRGHVREAMRWGAAMGRLRRVVHVVADVRLRQALDPAYRPLVPWATLVAEHEGARDLRETETERRQRKKGNRRR